MSNNDEKTEAELTLTLDLTHDGWKELYTLEMTEWMVPFVLAAIERGLPAGYQMKVNRGYYVWTGSVYDSWRDEVSQKP